MFRWIPYAMVRISAFFIAGILLGIYFQHAIPIDAAVYSLAFLGVLFLAISLARKKRYGAWLGAVGLSAVCLMGFIHLYFYREGQREEHLLNFEGTVLAYKAIIAKLPEEKEKSWKYEARITKVLADSKWQNVTAKVLLYVKKDSSNRMLFYGDEVVIKGSPDMLNGPSNPFEFDFKRFLSFKNIYHQDFINPDDIRWLSSIRDKDVKYYSFKVRQWASEVLKERLPRTQDRAIALALTLGMTDGVDNDLQNAYASSGAMHVLAVSGLHVGILYAIVLFFLKPIQNLAWSRWIVAVVSILILWGFAFVTGLSPSVLRAVTMFSFIALAKPFGRRTSIYNTLAASAFILLMFDPFLIMSVGFQLSYLAVLGIVVIHRPLYQLWEPQSAVLDWVWNISCVSIAAQLATFSLGLLYFHQFPVYFLFSNLFVIPGAILTLTLSLLVLATSLVPPLSSLVGQLLNWTIELLNMGVFAVEDLPNSLIENIYITTFQCWLLIIALAFIILLFAQRKLIYMKVALVFVIWFSLIQWRHYEREVAAERLVVYHVAGQTGLEWISNGRSYFVSEASLAKNTERVRFHIRPIRLFSGVKQVQTEFLTKSDTLKLWSFGGKTIGLVSNYIDSFPDDLHVDYLIVRDDVFHSLSEIQRIVKFDQLILDASNTRYIAERIKNENPGLVYSVQHEGAFHKKF